MNIQINTGHNIQGNEELIAKFSSTIKSALIRMSDHITKVEVHMKDEDGDKKGKNDKRCMIEAHLERRQPIVVTDHADTLNEALDGAIDKLISMMESILGRQRDQRSRKTKRATPESELPDEN
ncbi:MAG TPA: ribosomal subunit interface protein [Ignavibacteriales bacterium]|nr:ribosomal subunit interface protein [Ignavibacteriales bacterium]